jgi:rubrerythrin
MNLEKAIQTAIEYEIRIRDLYREAADQAIDPVGTRVFSALGDDENNHVAYLRDRLEKWRTTGLLTVDEIVSAIPSREIIEKEIGQLETRMSREDRKSEKQMLSKALAVEVETSNFYRKMVEEMSDDSRRMFARFLEIEDGHIAVVQAELDYLSHTGYWLDFKEFDME